VLIARGSRGITEHLLRWGLRNYLSSAMRKLGVHSRRDAVDLAKEEGWL
jgi:DNA-binding CsgD family transcriptional regulator